MNTKIQLTIIISSFVIILGLGLVAQIIISERFIHQEIETHLLDTETISLMGELQSEDFKVLIDLTPYLVELYGHVTLKVPCGSNGEQLLEIVEGVMPQFLPLEMNYVTSISDPPNYCIYEGDISNDVTFIGLKNTSEQTVTFSENAGYSVTITIHAELDDANDKHQFLDLIK